METVTRQSKTSKSNHSIVEVLEFCKSRNLPARVVGRWVWIKFESKPSAEIRQALKAFGGPSVAVNGRTTAAITACQRAVIVPGTSIRPLVLTKHAQDWRWHDAAI